MDRLFFNETAFLFWCHALWKLGSSNCCNFEMKHGTGLYKGLLFVYLQPSVNKTLCERIFGCGRTTGMILWTCLIAAKELSSSLTREDKSFSPLVCWTTQLIQYVSIHNKNSVISRQCLKIYTSSMQTCLEPNCNIGHQCLQPGE